MSGFNHKNARFFRRAVDKGIEKEYDENRIKTR